jgi:hypothetical protein
MCYEMTVRDAIIEASYLMSDIELSANENTGRATSVLNAVMNEDQHYIEGALSHNIQVSTKDDISVLLGSAIESLQYFELYFEPDFILDDDELDTALESISQLILFLIDTKEFFE